jgi:hypothetical protein
MNKVVDYLYDFSVSLTYEIHDSGSVDIEKFVSVYCQNQSIDSRKYNKILIDYCIYYVENSQSWFPEKEELSNWYSEYLKNKS